MRHREIAEDPAHQTVPIGKLLLCIFGIVALLTIRRRCEAQVSFRSVHQPLHILGLLRQEWVGKAFRLTGGDHAAFDTLPCHQFGEAEAGKDHTDRADDGAFVHPDVICGAGQPVAARSRHILDKGMD